VDTMTCMICGNAEGNRLLQAREKMNGTLDAFDYLQCRVCGHLHLVTEVADMGAYYAKGYYSFHTRVIPGWRQWLYWARTSVTLGGHSLAGRLLGRIKKPYYTYWVEKTGLQLGDRVLDVGCGAGNLIQILQCAGLKCTGIDPFLPEDSNTPEGVELRRADLLDEQQTVQAILFNHSFEHVPNPKELLQKAASLIEPDGCVVIRIPLSDSFAFFHYGADWFQWDAPRHQNLFTRDSFGRLAKECGLVVTDQIDDSSKIQFWASEEYQRNIFHNSKESYAHDDHQTHFSKRQIREFAQWAKWLNQMGAGDQATFICRRSADS
jgi:SAM-dependent methyltransferase